MSASLHPGDIAEIITDGAGDRHKGDRFEVESWDDGFEPSDPEYGDENYMQGPIVEGWDDRGTVYVEVKHVRLAHRADDIPRPSVQDFARALDIGSLRSDFEHDVTEYEDGTAYITFVDKRSGLSWTAVVRVASIERAS